MWRVAPSQNNRGRGKVSAAFWKRPAEPASKFNVRDIFGLRDNGVR
jgi:hypothetical protein